MRRCVVIFLIVCSMSGCAGGSRGTGTGLRSAPVVPAQRFLHEEWRDDDEECRRDGSCRDRDRDDHRWESRGRPL